MRLTHTRPTGVSICGENCWFKLNEYSNPVFRSVFVRYMSQGFCVAIILLDYRIFINHWKSAFENLWINIVFKNTLVTLICLLFRSVKQTLVLIHSSPNSSINLYSLNTENFFFPSSIILIFKANVFMAFFFLKKTYITNEISF